MNKFSLRVINVVCILCILFCYQSLIKQKNLEAALQYAREDNTALVDTQTQMFQAVDTKFADASQKLAEATKETSDQGSCVDESFATTDPNTPIAEEKVPASSKPAETGEYPDGTFSGSGAGFGGTVSVDVMILGGKITSIQITSAAGEDEAYLSMAEDIIPKIIAAQSAEVDTISGATFSSTGIRDAVAAALDTASSTTN